MDGVPVFTEFSAPYSHDISVPVGVSSFTLGARAADLAGNDALAQEVIIEVIPDMAPTLNQGH